MLNFRPSYFCKLNIWRSQFLTYNGDNFDRRNRRFQIYDDSSQ